MRAFCIGNSDSRHALQGAEGASSHMPGTLKVMTKPDLPTQLPIVKNVFTMLQLLVHATAMVTSEASSRKYLAACKEVLQGQPADSFKQWPPAAFCGTAAYEMPTSVWHAVADACQDR